MIGPEGTADRVAGWLTVRVPERLRLLEARLTTDPEDPVTLPDPSLVVAHETGPLGLEDWPAIVVLPARLEELTVVEQARAEGGETYRASYAVEVLGWVRAEDYAEVDKLRRRYVLAIREALLDRKQLAAAPAYGEQLTGTEFAVAPDTLREDYGPVVVDEAHRTIAGVRLTATVTVLEVLDGPAPMGTVDTPPAVDERPVGRTEPITNVVVHPGLM